MLELYEADFHKPGIYGGGRVWADASDVVARRPEVVAVAGLLWISWCVLGAAGFRVSTILHFKFVHTTSGCERPRAVRVDSVKGYDIQPIFPPITRADRSPPGVSFIVLPPGNHGVS